MTATFSIIPPLLSAMVLAQNRLLGLYYTTLHNYCQEFNFPSPPPPMEDVIDTFMADFEPAKTEIESIPCVATGKTARQQLRVPDDSSSTHSRPSSVGEHSPRRSASGLIQSGAATIPPRPNRVPSAPIPAMSSPATQSRPSVSSHFSSSTSRDHLAPTDFTTASRLGQGQTSPRPVSPSAVRGADYFSRRVSTSTTASTQSLSTTNSAAGAPAAAAPLSNVTNTNYHPSAATGASNAIANMGASAVAAAASKKKPPPPPPKKKFGMQQPDEFVIAQYTFNGQGEGDLSFREGDRIRIVKKTATDQDWWVGELDGVRGSFPANYCRPT